MKNRDVRDYQIAFLALFLLLGVVGRDWSLRPLHLFVTILATLAAQGVGEWLAGRRPPSFRSAWITALSLCLLLRANHAWILAMAGVLAIACKYLFTHQGKHFFNPSNFGIVAVLLLTRDAWVSPGQWGESGWYLLLFAGTGGMVLRKVGRLETTGAFFLPYALLEAWRNVHLGWTPDVFWHRLESGSLLLFSLFMITDPRAIPNATKSRILWSVSVAVLAFVLRNYYFVPTAIFWALFILSPATMMLDRIWKAPRFDWGQSRMARAMILKEARS